MHRPQLPAMDSLPVQKIQCLTGRHIFFRRTLPFKNFLLHFLTVCSNIYETWKQFSTSICLSDIPCYAWDHSYYGGNAMSDTQTSIFHPTLPFNILLSHLLPTVVKMKTFCNIHIFVEYSVLHMGHNFLLWYKIALLKCFQALLFLDSFLLSLRYFQREIVSTSNVIAILKRQLFNTTRKKLNEQVPFCNKLIRQSFCEVIHQDT